MIEYKGYTIKPETDPWEIKYGSKICVTDGEMVASFRTIPEAKDFVDDLTCDFHWHPLTQTLFDLCYDRKFWEKRWEDQLEYISKNPHLRQEVIQSAFGVLRMCQSKCQNPNKL